MPFPLVSAFFNWLRRAIIEAIESGVKSLQQQITKQMNQRVNLDSRPQMPDTHFELKGVEELMIEMKALRLDIDAVVEPITRAHTSALCYDLIKASEPIGNGGGGTADARKVGEERLRKEIYRFFRPVSDLKFGQLLMAEQWDALADYDWTPTSPSLREAKAKGDYKAMWEVFNRTGWKREELEIVNEPTEILHRSARNSTGSIKTNRKVYVKNQEAIYNYFLKMKNDVGKMASGWWSIAQRLGKPSDGYFNTAHHIRKNIGTGTIVKVSKPMEGTSYTITNTLGNHNNFLVGSGGLNAALVKRKRLFQKDLIAALTKAIDKANAKNSNKAP
jgi:hypothetical protein